MIDALSKIWSLLTLVERRNAIVMLILVICMAGLETLGVLSIAPFLSVLARPEIIQENQWYRRIFHSMEFANHTEFIVAMGTFTMAIVVFSSIFKTITFHLMGRFINMRRHSLSVRLLNRYLNQPYEFFLSRNPSELTKNVLSEVDQIIFDLLQPLTMLVAQGAVAVAMIVLVLFYDPWMAILIVAAVGFLYASIYMAVRQQLKKSGRERQQADSDRYKACNEALGGIKDVKVNHAAASYLQGFSSASHKFSRHSATAETLSQSPLYIVEAVGYSGLILISLFLLWRSGDMSKVLPALGLYGFAAYRLLPAVQIIYRGFSRLRFSSTALNSIYRDFSLPTPAERPPVDSFVPKKEIHLRDIHFSYPSRPDAKILAGVDIVIPANSTVGIIGKSGAGKSTVMDILLALLKPQSGALTVDGVEIDSASESSWQRSIGYVPQHIYLADVSLAENIAFGVAPENINMQAVERSARMAQIHDFAVNELPQGYLTLVGDRGVRLSGGQRQRVGIARALYRDPPVLCMDEATSALDMHTEKAVNDAIRSLSGLKTVVIIAHRETSLENCDVIINLG